MQLLGCKNIAKTFEIFQDPMNVYMVNEVFLGKDLCKVEQHATSKGVQVSESWWKGIFRQCFEALPFMHQQAMMHCDIKEPNLMLRTENYANPEVVLIDFGVSKAMAARDDGMCSGTPGYMPPETMNTGKWHARGDVFSMGVVMMQLLTHKVPDEDKAKLGILIGIFLDGCGTMDDIKTAVNSRVPPFHLMPPQWPGIKQICKTCLDKDFRNRKKAPVILKDPWFESAIGQSGLAIEKVMQPANQMATVGITPDMIKSFA
jgi:serine/threonine protein kinase